MEMKWEINLALFLMLKQVNISLATQWVTCNCKRGGRREGREGGVKGGRRKEREQRKSIG
jgi:hypothetical protein